MFRFILPQLHKLEHAKWGGKHCSWGKCSSDSSSFNARREDVKSVTEIGKASSLQERRLLRVLRVHRVRSRSLSHQSTTTRPTQTQTIHLPRRTPIHLPGRGRPAAAAWMFTVFQLEEPPTPPLAFTVLGPVPSGSGSTG